jgi:hypothetical protein
MNRATRSGLERWRPPRGRLAAETHRLALDRLGGPEAWRDREVVAGRMISLCHSGEVEKIRGARGNISCPTAYFAAASFRASRKSTAHRRNVKRSVDVRNSSSSTAGTKNDAANGPKFIARGAVLQRPNEHRGRDYRPRSFSWSPAAISQHPPAAIVRWAVDLPGNCNSAPARRYRQSSGHRPRERLSGAGRWLMPQCSAFASGWRPQTATLKEASKNGSRRSNHLH